MAFNQLRGSSQGLRRGASLGMALHSWEMPTEHSWEEGGDFEEHWGEGLEDDAREPSSTKEAGDELASYLVAEYVEGKLSAKAVCCIAYWASKAGAQGAVSDLSLKPNSPSGHFARHLRKLLRVSEQAKRLYEVKCPGHCKHSMSRSTITLLANPPHEALHKEVAARPQIHDEHKSMIDKNEYAQLYYQHPVAIATQYRAIPMALYMDGVPYTKGDSVLGVFVYNLVTNNRHLVLVLRKSRVCACGCKGWCSYFEVFRFVSWSLMASALGKFPLERHDHNAWNWSDNDRVEVADGDLGFVGAFNMIKGDWAEYCHTLGFPTWASVLYTCFACKCTRSNMFGLRSMSPLSFPFAPFTHADYEEACVRAEIHVTLSEADLRLVCALLVFDKRDDGARGRALSRGIDRLGLKAWDRLEPSDSCPDVGASERSSTFPVQCVFWRRSLETRARHRNPLFAVAIGRAGDILMQPLSPRVVRLV